MKYNSRRSKETRDWTISCHNKAKSNKFHTFQKRSKIQNTERETNYYFTPTELYLPKNGTQVHMCLNIYFLLRLSQLKNRNNTESAVL
jgi:hypothetical protein